MKKAMKSIIILLLLFWELNTCITQMVIPDNNSVTYILCIDFIENVDFDVNNNIKIKLNHKGLQEIQSVNFQNYK
jgi:hypothetical protein